MEEGEMENERGEEQKPDPTVLTTEQLERETTHLRREMDAKHSHLDDKITANFDLDVLRHTALDLFFNQRIDDLEQIFDMHLREAREQLTAALVDNQRAVEAAFEASTQARESAFEASSKAIESAFAASDKAIDKSERATEKRFDDVNQFRQQFTTEITKLVSRDLFDQHIKESGSRIDILTNRIEQLTNKITEIRATSGGERDRTAELRANFSMMVAGLAVIVTIVIAFMTMSP